MQVLDLELQFLSSAQEHLLAQSLKAVLIEAVERWMVPLRNSLDHFGARRVPVVVVDNNAAIQCDLSMLLFGISGGL